MENRPFGRLLFIAVLVGTLTGCVSTTGARKCTKTDTIVLEIDASGNTTPTVRKEVDVCKNKQDVEWIAKDALGMEVTVLEVPEGKTPGGDQGKVKVKKPPCVMNPSGGGYTCTLSKLAHEEEGWVCYKIALTDANNNPQMVDPYLIIKK